MLLENDIITEAKKYVSYLLLPLEDYYYHHYEHALDVMERAVYLWGKEWANEDEKEILALAGLFHDTGFVIEYDKNEYIGAKIARNYLKTILYPEERIAQIEALIIATIPSKKPNNLLEQIIKDADLDNLWREDFFDKWDKLKKELELIKNIKIKDPDWHHASLDLFHGHTFYTKTQAKEREEQKKENFKRLRLALDHGDIVDTAKEIKRHI